MPTQKIADSPLKKIADLPQPCQDPEHDPPGNIVLEPGIYQHTCPGCGQVRTFTVRAVTCE